MIYDQMNKWWRRGWQVNYWWLKAVPVGQASHRWVLVL